MDCLIALASLIVSLAFLAVAVCACHHLRVMTAPCLKIDTCCRSCRLRVTLTNGGMSRATVTGFSVVRRRSPEVVEHAETDEPFWLIDEALAYDRSRVEYVQDPFVLDSTFGPGESTDIARAEAAVDATDPYWLDFRRDVVDALDQTTILVEYRDPAGCSYTLTKTLALS